MENTSYRWVKENPPKNPKNFTVNKDKLPKYIGLGVLALVLLVGILTCFYTVDDKQQAVVTTFGQVTDITEPGLHFKLPFGIQRVRRVDVNVYQTQITLNSTSRVTRLLSSSMVKRRSMYPSMTSLPLITPFPMS